MTKKPYYFVPITEIISPQKTGPLHVMQGYWWVVTPNGEVVFFDEGLRYPAANRHKEIAEKMLKFFPEGFQAEFIPWAYLKFEISDYT